MSDAMEINITKKYYKQDRRDFQNLKSRGLWQRVWKYDILKEAEQKKRKEDDNTFLF